ncbi:hypothetical protein CBP36_19705 (plasmid) [Acidovorax carolinensis]|uniref:DotA/TraY family protein n=1 Tax=Acidovorax carolinensis TaxID=553814 RepID=A0A240UJE3_9BURK|nr:DotA/TraY family protein [Acidovorax carolinensis]ART61193.1 hypothetical protein CBP36_19705 [Acidovorax carolinensis]
MKIKKLPFIMGQMILAYLIMAPALAFAQSSGATPESFEPGAQDLTHYILRSIFGEWTTGETVPLMGEAMRVLNIFALTFGTLMFSYVAVVGTLNTAQDGEALGRKWSTMWVPLRFVVGTALLVPLASGYSTIQHLILWLALVGGGAASQIWGAALDSFTSPDKAATMIQNSEDYRNTVKKLMRRVLKAEVCVAILNSQYKDSGQSFSPAFGMRGPQSSKVGNAAEWLSRGIVSVDVYHFKWGALNDLTGKDSDACGTLKTTTFVDAKVPSLSFGGVFGSSKSQDVPVSTGADEMAILKSYESIVNGQARGIQASSTYLRVIAEKLANPEPNQKIAPEFIENYLNYAVTAYLGAASPAATHIVQASESKLNKFIESSRTSGWLMASSSFFQMSRIRTAAINAMTSMPEFADRGDTSLSSKSMTGIAEGPMYEDLKAAEDFIIKSMPANEEAATWWNGGLGQFISSTIAEVFSFDPKNQKHALMQIKDTGDRILTTAGTAFTAGVAAYTAQAAAGGTLIGGATDLAVGWKSGIKAFFEVMGPMIFIGFTALFGVGVVMAFLLPMLPFMLSVGSILGWLMALFSAIVAAPIWIAGHLHPEGDGFAGKAVGGYMLLLETVTRPIFIIFGLIGAFVIIDPMLKLVAWLFQANMQGVQGNSETGLISIVMFAVIYVSITWTVTRQANQLIHSLSEKVYNWIGGQNAGYDQARDFGTAAQQSSSRAAGGATSGAQATLAAATKGIARRSQLQAPQSPPNRSSGNQEE